MKVKLRRNRHNLSHYRCGTAYPGEIIPVGCVSVIPGDTFKHSVSGFIRFMPMNRPIMHRAWAAYYSFFVPSRICWSGFEDFITRKEGAAAMPSMQLGAISQDDGARRLGNYLGINTQNVDMASTTAISVLKFIAYNKIVNQWFYDQDLQTPLSETSTTPSDYDIRRGCWRKDNFTAARPWPQKGPEITIPLGTEAPVVVQSVATNPGGVEYGAIYQGGGVNLPESSLHMDTTQSSATQIQVELHGVAELSEALSASVIQFRRAMNLQALAERLSNFGSRYPELLASMGVKSSDARLQIPEYLGGTKAPINFSEVLRTGGAAGTEDEEIGGLYGHGISAAGGRPYRRFFEEYGYVITVMQVVPESIYTNAIDRSWFHGLVDGANDYYTPELERIGFQEIYNKEVAATVNGTGAGEDDEVWGYGPRYMELRHELSRVCGELQVGDIEDNWTWARGFDVATDGFPALNAAFVECNPSGRIFQDTNSEPIIFCVNHNLIAQRMLTPFITGRTI